MAGRVIVQRRGWVCEECGSGEFERIQSGFWICTSCGVQRGQAEEKLEYDDARPTSKRRIQLLKLPDREAAAKPSLDPIALTLHESRLLLETFHFLLKHQTMFLVSRFHCPPQLFSVVGRVWLGYIESWRAAGWGQDDQHMIVYKSAPGLRKQQLKEWIREEMRTRDEQQHVSNDTKHDDAAHEDDEKGEAERESGEDQTESKEQRAEEGKAERRQRLKRRRRAAPVLDVAELSMPLSLAIVFLALQSCRHPLIMHILLSLARIDLLPYLAFVHPSRLPPRLHNLLLTAPAVRSFFRPVILPSTRTLHILVSHLCHCLGLTSPTALPTAHKHPGRGTAASQFVLHAETFNPAAVALMYCEQLQVPAVLHGLVLEVLRLWEAVLGGADGAIADEVSVMVCVLTAVKMVYGLDTADGLPEPDTTKPKKRRREDERQDEDDERKAGRMRRERKEADSDTKGDEQQEGEDEDEESVQSVSPLRAPAPVEVARWRSEEEMRDYDYILKLQREEDERRERQQREAAALAQHCDALRTMLALSTAAPAAPSPSVADRTEGVSAASLHGELVRLFHRPTFFPSSFSEARRYPVESQRDLLRLWNDAILPPSLSLDDFDEYIDKIKQLQPPHSPATPPAPSLLASFFAMLSSALSTAPSGSLGFSRFTLYYPGSAGRYHRDHEVLLYSASLLCGESVDGLDRRIRRFALALHTRGQGKRLHSRGWKRGSRDAELRRRKERRRQRQQGEEDSEQQWEDAEEDNDEDDRSDEDSSADSDVDAGDSSGNSADSS